MRLLVSFERENIRLGASTWLLSGQTGMRFEWLALLALRQKETTGEGWVSTHEIGRLPGWSGRSRHHIVTNVGRYLGWLAGRGIRIVDAESPWAGPYRLNVPGNSIAFDIPVEEVYRRLGLQQVSTSSREVLLRFIFKYARAESLFFQGKLAGIGGSSRGLKGAQGRFLAILDDPKSNYGPKLRSIALLGAVRVLFQIGRFRFAREILESRRSLLAATHDNALTARYYLAVAWSFQREASGDAADQATLRALRNAARHLKRTTDREVAGMLAYRTSGFLTKHGRHEEAVAELVRAVEANLVIGNYHNVQAYCVDIGSDLHRLGPESYREAHHWILVGLAICRWMGIGNDNAHGETILGKMYIEKGQSRIARFWLDRALLISQQAKNTVSLADAQMVMGLWYQAFGSDSQTVASLVEALRNFRTMPHFDCAQKEHYMARKFPEAWKRVLATVGGPPSRKAMSERSNQTGGRRSRNVA